MRASVQRLLLIGLLVSVCALPAQAKQSREARLDKGEVLVTKKKVPGSDMPKMKVQAVIEAPADVVWGIVSDCDNLHRHMSSIAKSRVVKRRGRIYECETEVHIPGPFSNLTSVTEVVEVPGPPVWKRTWTLLHGDYHVVDGSWRIEDFQGSQKRTLATYTIHAIPKISLPDFILKLAHGRATKRLIRDVRKAVGDPTR